jgi:hypothetical protein
MSRHGDVMVTAATRRQSRKACRLRCHTLQLPRSFLAARFALRLCAFLSHGHGENCRAGEAGKGVWGKTWNRAAWGARGGPGFPPVRFRIGPPSCWSRSRAVVFPTSPSGPPRGGGEVGKMEAARSERIRAGRRGDRDGNALNSARTSGRYAVQPLRGTVRRMCGGGGPRPAPPHLPTSRGARNSERGILLTAQCLGQSPGWARHEEKLRFGFSPCVWLRNVPIVCVAHRARQ